MIGLEPTKPLLSSMRTVQIVFDKFHIIGTLNTVIDEVLRCEWRNAAKENKNSLRGSDSIYSAIPIFCKMDNVIALHDSLKPTRLYFRPTFSKTPSVHSGRMFDQDGP